MPTKNILPLPLRVGVLFFYFLPVLFFLCSSSGNVRDIPHSTEVHFSQVFDDVQSSIFKSPMAKKAYDLVLDLRFKEAKEPVEVLEKIYEGHPFIDYIQNLQEFLIVFIDENPRDFNAYSKHLQERIYRISKFNRNSPLTLYFQAEIELQWAILHLKFGNYFKSFILVKSAYEKLEENSSRFPSFIANKKSLGILHGILGTIPSEYKWGARLISGMEGTIAEGEEELKAVLRYAETKSFFFHKEVVAFYCIFQMYIKNDPEAAIVLLDKQDYDLSTQPIACFMYANIEMKRGNMDKVIEILAQRPTGRAYYPFHFLTYLSGVAKLYQLDPKSEQDLKAFISNYPGKNYVKDTYLKLAWHGLIFSGNTTYQHYLDRIPTVGVALTDEDKAAEKEALTGRNQHPELLKARLLFDGGSYYRALYILNLINPEDLNVDYQLEYEYRRGRTFHELCAYEKAIQLYKGVLKKGKTSERYFACSAALYLGMLYEDIDHIDDAREAYKLCLSIMPDEYRQSLHQKAKSGLSRLKLRLE